MKNKEIMKANISEAKEELEEIEKRLEKDDYDEVELRIALEHAYHHLNYAWNIRNVSEEELVQHTDKDFKKWSRYPKEDILEYE
jgi:hypothetical protein